MRSRVLRMLGRPFRPMLGIWPFRPIRAVWRKTPVERKLSLLPLLFGLIFLLAGMGDVVTSSALRHGERAGATVVEAHPGDSGPLVKAPGYLRVEFRSANGGQHRVRMERFLRPQAATGADVEIQYAHRRYVGWVAQQNGFRPTFARTWAISLFGAVVLAIGIGAFVWSFVRKEPPPRTPTGPKVFVQPDVDRSDWSHRLRSPDPPR